MKYLLSLFLCIIFYTAHAVQTDLMGEQLPAEAEKSVASLDKDLAKAFKTFLKNINKEISKAEKKGNVGLAASLNAAKQKVLKSRHFSEIGEASEKTGAVAIKISNKWLKKEFNATKMKVDKRGIVTLYYDFTSAKESYDFEFSDTEVRIGGGMLSLGALVRGTHKAKWDGAIDVSMELSHANRKGSYVTIGNTRITGSNYNAWLIHLGNNKATFSDDYTNTGSLKMYRQLQYKLTRTRSILNFGSYNGEPVTVGSMGGSMRKGGVIVHGADGGANIKYLMIKGTLNMDLYLE